jgi:hypothetical protein
MDGQDFDFQKNNPINMVHRDHPGLPFKARG